MRVLPTNKPAFFAPEQAGGDFPFGDMQNSLVLAGTPLHAPHTSSGHNDTVITQDDVPIVNRKGRFHFTAQMGTILPGGEK